MSEAATRPHGPPDAVGHVVVGFDDGPSGRDALTLGVRWSRASGDRLLVVNVHPTPPAAGISRVDAEWAAYEREQAAGLLDQARSLVPADVDARFERLDSTSAAHALHDLSESGALMVVVGGRGSDGHRRTRPGSTARRLLQGAGAAVTLAPCGYAETGAEPLRRLAVAFVDTADGRTALEAAARMAARVHGTLDVVTVVPETRVSPAMGEPVRFAAHQEADFVAGLQRALEAVPEEVRGEARTLEGPVVEALTELGPADADLLVCGSRGYGPVRRVFLGGVSHGVVRRSRLPVTVVPRGAS